MSDANQAAERRSLLINVKCIIRRMQAQADDVVDFRLSVSGKFYLEMCINFSPLCSQKKSALRADFFETQKIFLTT